MAKETLLKCKFSDSGRGFGFAEIIEGEWMGCADIYIGYGDTLNAMTGDTVLVHRYRAGEAGYSRGNEGEVTKILEHGNTEIIGTFTRSSAVGTVYPEDEKLHAIVHVAGGDMGSAGSGDKVAVKITEFPKRRRDERLHILSGYVSAVFGKADTREANYAAILHRHSIPTEFSDAVIFEAEDSAAREILPAGRTDLRDTPTLTIDGADAKDLDDAISLSRTADGWLLGVHIADVSHYVPAAGEVDREAYRRGTSVYFVDKVVPMLPTALSNGACSLNGGVDRYALSALITLNEAGDMIAFDFKKSIIRSNVRGVYTEVNDLFEKGRESAFFEKYAPVYDMLTDMRTLYGVLRDAAALRGQLSMESPEAKFVLDEKGIPADIYPAVRGEAEMLIEQFMLCANVAAARWLTAREMPCLYRVHPDPMPDKMRAFAVFAHNMGLDSAGIGEGVSTHRLSALLCEAEEKGVSDVVSGVMLRALSKARYSEKPGAHFGLALPLYAHFTSPIRRYPDLFVHRAITAVLEGKRRPAHPAESARISSEAELRAVAAEREIEDLYMAQYASLHIGEEYEAVICSVCHFGVFARTGKLFEGLLPLAELFDGGEADFDEDSLTLSGHVHGQRRTWRLGDRLTVRVAHADVPAGKIDFTLAGSPVLPELQNPSHTGEYRARHTGGKRAAARMNRGEKPGRQGHGKGRKTGKKPPYDKKTGKKRNSRKSRP